MGGDRLHHRWMPVVGLVGAAAWGFELVAAAVGTPRSNRMRCWLCPKCNRHVNIPCAVAAVVAVTTRITCTCTEELEERLVRVDVLKESLAARQAAQRPVQRQVIRKGGFQKGSDDEDSDFE